MLISLFCGIVGHDMAIDNGTSSMYTFYVCNSEVRCFFLKQNFGLFLFGIWNLFNKDSKYNLFSDT